MKVLSIILQAFAILWLSAGWAAAGMIINPYSFAVSTPPEWLVFQGFEGTGYDNGEVWTAAVVSDGTVDPNSTTLVLAGSQSLRITLPTSNDGASTYREFAGASKVYCRFMFNLAFISQVATTTLEIASIRNGANTLASLVLYGEQKLQVSVAGGSSNQATADLPLAGTRYIWFEYEAGTGSNAVARAGYATTDIKPTLTASGSQTCVVSNGTATANATRLYLGRTGTTAYRYTAVYDEIRAKTTTF